MDVARLAGVLRARRDGAPVHGVVGAGGASRRGRLARGPGAAAGSTGHRVSAPGPKVAIGGRFARSPRRGVLCAPGTDPVTGAPKRLAADAPEVLVGATRRALPAGSRLLVFQPFASWFEYSLSGDPVMVDSRIELFPAEVWRDYDTAIVAGEGWQAILDRNEIAGVILPPGAVLARELREDAAWTPRHGRPRGVRVRASLSYSVGPIDTRPERAAIRRAASRFPTPSLP